MHWNATWFRGLVLGLALIQTLSGQEQGTPYRPSGPIGNAKNSVPTSTQGLLVLHNGNVIEGVVEQVGDRYRVLIGQGEIGIAADKVRLVARSYDDAYQQMRSVQRNTVSGHLELSVWCIEHELFPQAADELLGAMQLDSTRPEIRVVQRRLEARARSSAAPARTPGKSTNSAQPERTVTLASAASPVAELQMKDQPDEVIATFRADILPMLLNSCAANRCHGNAGQGGFEMFRPLTHRVSKRVVDRNWNIVMKWVDVNQPENSALLLRAQTAHGSQNDPSLPSEDPRFARLANWVTLQGMAMGDNGGTKPEAVASKTGFKEGFPTTGAPPASVPNEAPPAPRGNAARLNSKPHGKDSSTAAAPSASTPGATDPFDPAPFNRRFHPSGPPPAELVR